MMNKDANNENLERRSIYFRDIRSFSIIIFMVSLVTAVLINTQAGMKQLAEVLAFFALGNLIIGIAVQLINENLERRSIYFRDIRSFSIIIFMVSLVTAVLINTQAGMKQLAEVLAFFALGNLIIGIATATATTPAAAQSIKVRK
ncbi:MAG: hypothetical protein M3275_14035 [Thermoproteota archaeon]|nr:hypothetical protein [Thermoproteota archaeon]